MSGFILRAAQGRRRARTSASPSAKRSSPCPPTSPTRSARRPRTPASWPASRVERILNEPTAAALAYGLDHLDAEQLVLVYDLGGGTFDVSVLEMFDGVLDVKASGGQQPSRRRRLRSRARRLAGRRVRPRTASTAQVIGRRARLRTRPSGQGGPVGDSRRPRARCARGARGPIRSSSSSRAPLEAIVADLVQPLSRRSSRRSRRAARADAITDVVLVGGSSRVPLVRRLVSSASEGAARGVHPDESVALGAAVQAGLKSGTIAARPAS